MAGWAQWLAAGLEQGGDAVVPGAASLPAPFCSSCCWIHSTYWELWAPSELGNLQVLCLVGGMGQTVSRHWDSSSSTLASVNSLHFPGFQPTPFSVLELPVESRRCAHLYVFFSIDKPDIVNVICLGKQRLHHKEQQTVCYDWVQMGNTDEPWPSYLWWLSSV